MERFIITPEVREIARRIYEWGKTAIYGYGSRGRDDYSLINYRGWVLEDGSAVVLTEPELTLALRLAQKYAEVEDGEDAV